MPLQLSGDCDMSQSSEVLLIGETSGDLLALGLLGDLFTILIMRLGMTCPYLTSEPLLIEF